MKTKLFYLVTLACLLMFPILTFGQTALRPTMGTTENFVLFTTDGALTNQGASQLTLLTGDVGSDTAPNDTQLGNIDGTIYMTGDTEGVTAQAAADLVDLYNELLGLVKDYDLPTLLGGPDAFPHGVYSIDESVSLNGNLILDADGNPDALFIFRITAPGTFSTTANSSIELRNGAQACNVFWLVEDAVSISTGNFMKGTIVSAAAISFAATTEFEGRALTKVGAITIDNNEQSFLAQKPIGCGSPVLTGPPAPDLKTAGCFALFTGNGSMVNSGESTIVGDVGTNVGLTEGFELPTTVDGTVYPGPTPETAQADLDLSDAFDYLVTLPNDIELLAPALFGYGLILTPHTYLLAAETHLTGNLYLDAQGNPDAVFVIKVSAAFSTAVDAEVLLINEAKAENVYWLVTGAVSIEGGTIFKGTIVATGAVELKSAAELTGRALTKTGDFSTVAITAISPGCGTSTVFEITTQPIDQEACIGGSVSFTVVATGTDLTYQWRKGTVNLDDLTENISGATTATLTIDPVALSDAGSDYNVVVTGSVDPFTVISNNVSLTINSGPEITLQPSNQTACIGGLVSFTVEATGADLTYQWRKGEVNLVDGGAIFGATTATLTIDPVALADAATDYNVVITGACAPAVTSSNASLEIGSAAEITEQPANQTACVGASVSFTVVATGTDLTYQWRKGIVELVDGGAISGATTATLTINPVALADAATDYNVVITGACAPAVTSLNASLEIGSAPEITLQPENQTACVGASVSFTVVATGTDLTYQWRKGTVDLVDGATISGATTSTLTIDPVALLDAATNYNVVITGACAPAVTSSNASLTVNSAPEITLQPADQIGCEGGSVSFTVEATGTDLTYQWRKGTVNLVDGAAISGATTATLTIDPVALLDAAPDYNVVITGACAPAVTSLNASLEIGSAPEITLQPENQTACVGASVSFAVVATGANLTYQWRKGAVNLVDGATISGATTSTLTIDPVALLDAATNYNVVITGACAPAVTSSNASLTVNSAPEITLQPADQIGCEGGSVSFTVVATGTDIIYQWRKGAVVLTNTGNISGATSATLTINPISVADEATNYNVVVSGICAPAVTSSNASLEISTAIEITTQPANQIVCVGSQATFSVVATGVGLTYQWRKGLVNLTNSGNISGATSATLIINPVSVSDEAPNYDVVVSGTCGTPVASNNASLVVNTSPVITEQPINQTVEVGGVASFSVTATGTDLTYQWRKGTVELTNTGIILGATSANLIIAPVSESDAATDYNVVVSGACDPAATSVNVSLTVSPTGISDIDSENLLTLYPNPFNASVNIELNDVLHGKRYELLIYNAYGVLVVKKTITNQITVIDTSQFATGLYFYHVIGNDKAIQSGKLIKQQ